VQAVAPTNKVLIVHEESEFRTRGLRFLRKQNKGRLIVPHTRGIGPRIVQAARPILTVPEDSEFLPGTRCPYKNRTTIVRDCRLPQVGV
jgi:hypothetical protein